MSFSFAVELLAFLFASNFYANAAVFGIIIFLLCLYFNNWCIEKSVSLAFIILAGISYFFIYSANYGFPPARVLFSRMAGPIVLFISGSIVGKLGEKKLADLGLIIAFGMAFHGMLNMLINRDANVITSVGRGITDVWGGVIAATGQNLLMAMVTALLFYFVFCEKRKVKFLGIAAVVLSIIGTFINASRTLLYVVAISFACMIVYYCIKAVSITRKMKIMMATLFIACLGVIAITTNFMGINDWINSSGLFLRYAGNMSHMMTQTGRLAHSEYVIDHFFEYPFGNMPVNNYAHNLWLDIDIEVGWIPMCMHVLFFVTAAANVVKYAAERKESPNEQILLISLFLAMTMEFFVEPVLMGNPYFYMCFCFLAGGIITHNKMKAIRQKRGRYDEGTTN